jgi:sugar phosphate isomerase/epimerase
VILGYNTNGFAHHRLLDAVEIIAELGYGGVALTPDVNHLDPTAEYGYPLEEHPAIHELTSGPLGVVIETGARFILDARRKHRPTLVSPTSEGRAVRRAYLSACVDLAAAVGADTVSFWSGAPDDSAPHRTNLLRLVDNCKRLADHAADRGVRLAFEPEPGMFIDTMPKFAALHARVNHPAFGLTLDVGHLVCTYETPVGDHVRRWRDWLWNVHLDDMRPGVHDHLMFGDGAVDFADVFAALREIGYTGMASVELSRHSHDAVNTARRSIAFLRPFVTS